MVKTGENVVRIRPFFFLSLEIIFKKVCEKLLTDCVENARINLALEGTAKK